MTKSKTADLKSLQEMIDRPDYSAIRNVYLQINLRSFMDYFISLTNRAGYYETIFSELVKISQEVFASSSCQKLTEHLTLGAMLFAAETFIKQKPNDSNKAIFIIEKVLMEPLAVCARLQTAETQINKKGNFKSC